MIEYYIGDGQINEGGHVYVATKIKLIELLDTALKTVHNLQQELSELQEANIIRINNGGSVNE